MAKVHILDGGINGYRAVVHLPVPQGNNLVGNSWKDCIIGVNGVSATKMLVGTGIGQISQSEADKIATGNVIELDTVIGMNADGAAPTPSEIASIVDSLAATAQLNYSARLKYYGYTQN